jgi:hypothetical protein
MLAAHIVEQRQTNEPPMLALGSAVVWGLVSGMRWAGGLGELWEDSWEAMWASGWEAKSGRAAEIRMQEARRRGALRTVVGRGVGGVVGAGVGVLVGSLRGGEGPVVSHQRVTYIGG